MRSCRSLQWRRIVDGRGSHSDGLSVQQSGLCLVVYGKAFIGSAGSYATLTQITF